MNNRPLCEDISVAISCMQDYRDTIHYSDNTKHYYEISERIERLFKFYYQLIGFDPIINQIEEKK